MAEESTKIIRPQAGFQEKFVRSNVDFAIGGSSLGSGKAGLLDSHVVTPFGLRKVRDLKVGDMVSNPDTGGAEKIIQLHPIGVFDFYRVSFSDGTHMDCSSGHLWKVRMAGCCNGSYSLWTADMMYKFVKENHSSVELHTPVTSPVDFHPSISEPVKSPYEFGVNCIDGIRHQLEFIPKRYKYAPIEDRRAVINGLLYSRGVTEFNGCSSYSTISKRLANDIVFIVRSLGGIASVTSERLSLARRIYKISISLWRDDREKVISGIEYIGKKKGRCITVDNPSGLYLTDDFIVTHNSFAAVLAVAEPSLDPNFRALFLRNNLGDLRSGGGLLDNFREAYGNSVEIVESGEPRVTFPSGARVDVTHVSDQSREKVLQRFKGRQYDFIYFDEGTGFTWDCFTAIYTRNRGKAKWTGKVRMTTNPDRDHWIREFIDWYIGFDGTIMESRDGVVRYFFIAGETVKDVVWGDTKEEVYEKCKIQIDRIVKKVNGKSGNLTWQDMIKSFTFYLGRMSENKAMLQGNDGYAGSVAVMGGRNAQQLLEANWNVSVSETFDTPIKSYDANNVFTNDPQINGDRWITCDLADVGTDNFIAIAWDGFHVEDILILGKTTPRINAERLKQFADQHRVADSHIIYDGVRGLYVNDYIREAIPFISYRAPVGIYATSAARLKDECYLRLANAIENGRISFEDGIAERTYEHQNLRDRITIANEFLEECSVVRFKEMSSGRKQLYGKKEMNKHLGKGRSMDLLDPMAMRMYPVLQYPYGDELEMTSAATIDRDRDECESSGRYVRSIYDDSEWY